MLLFFQRKPLIAYYFFTAIFAGLISCSPKEEPLVFYAIGDVPYHNPEDFDRLDNMIEHLNAQSPGFTVHVGDIKSGSSLCSDDYYQEIYQRFIQFKHPFFYTPGDNEWTDCDRPLCGEYDPMERLDKIREIFFSEGVPMTNAGQMPAQSQSRESGYEKFAENALWQYGGVVFGTLHIVGSNNNLFPNHEAKLAEYQERNTANLYWLERIFQEAENKKPLGVVIFLHAALRYFQAENNGFSDITRVLQEKTLAFGKPVLVIYGDHHKFMVDKPMRTEDKKVVVNYTAVQVFGDRDMHAVKFTIDQNNPQVFVIEQEFVPGN
ncbi:MAG: metallophosphoesterase [Cyclobacteriaceae bacterium]|nr:metallophosphoesterase [Cyclobacteriaceae bacterium]